MSTNLIPAAFATAPVYTGTVNATTVAAGEPQRLSGTGATGAENGTALPVGRYATLQVAGTAVRARWGATSSVEADTTDVYLGVGATFAWYVEESTQFISIQAADGSSAFEAHVWSSSPRGF